MRILEEHFVDIYKLLKSELKGNEQLVIFASNEIDSVCCLHILKVKNKEKRKTKQKIV